MKKIRNTLVKDSMGININRLISVLRGSLRTVVADNLYPSKLVRQEWENLIIKGIVINNLPGPLLFNAAELVHKIKRISRGVSAVLLLKMVIRTDEKF